MLEDELERMDGQRAIMDIGARWECETEWDRVKWLNPRLDSKSGIHGDDRPENDFMGMMDTFLDNQYKATAIIWKKRGDEEGP